jgi:hypothetical protein
MQHIAAVLKQLVNQHLEIFQHYSETDWSAKSNPEKWSKKEIIGHLIDSAMTNLRRFVVTQYTENQNIVYDQNQWVMLQHYQSATTADLLALWRLLNFQIARTVENIPAERLTQTCDTGKYGPELYSLAWLIEDYVAHAEHHLRQITGVKS